MSPVMAGSQCCSQCAAELDPGLPRGLCGQCLISLGLATGPAEPPTVVSDASPTVEPLEIAPLGRFGDYELIEEIARGGMGVVYKARQLSLGRTVAVKMILAGPFVDKKVIQRFRAEVTAAALLQHPNIVQVHEVGIQAGQHYFSMEYVEGQNLAQLVGNRPLPPSKAATYLKVIAQAIHYAHGQGILHRDLKPSNVLVDSATDQPRVTDFGLAKRMDGESSLTVTGQVLGSPNFMPPEQASSDRGKVGRHSDVYALGAILYYLLTARSPFQGESLPTIVTQVLNNEPISPRLLNPAVPRDLETICLKCLEKEPERRYQTARELTDELGRFLSSQPIQVRPITRAERAWRWGRRKPVVASLAVTSALLLLVVAVGGPIAAYRINQERLRTRRSLYASNLGLASEKVHEGAFDHARELLRRHVPKPGEQDLRNFEWRYLAGAVQESEPFRTLAGIPGSGGYQRTFLFSAEHFLYNRSSGLLRAWDMATWESVRFLPPAAVRWQWDLSREAAYAVDDTQHSLTVCSLPKFESAATLRLPGPISIAAMSRDRQALAVAFQENASHRIMVWDLARDVRIGVLGSFEAAVSTLSFSRDGALLAAGSSRGVIGLWDLKRGQPLPAPPSGPSVHKILEFTPDNKRLLFDDDANLSVWDIEQSQPFLLELAGEKGKVPLARSGKDGLWYFGLSPDAKHIVVALGPRDLTLLDSRTLQTKATFHGHRGLIWAIAFSPDGKLMASSSIDQTVRIWELATQTEVGIVGGFGERISDVQFSRDGQSIVLIGGSGQIRVHKLSAVVQRGLVAKLPGREGISRLAVSPDARHLATISVAGTLDLWDRASGSRVRSVNFPRRDEENYGNLAFSPKGERLAWVTGDALRIMLVGSGEISTNAIDGNREVNSIAFSPDGRELAFGCGKQLMIYEVLAGRQQSFAATANEVTAVGYSPDGALLALGENQGAVTLCERANGRVRWQEVSAHGSGVSDVEISPDGRLLATCSADATIKLWRVAVDGLRLQCTLHGHMGYVSSVAFSPDGTRLGSASSDKTLKVWDTQTATELATLYGHHGSVLSVEFAANGRTIFSAGLDGEIHFWEAPPLSQIRLTEE